MLQRQIIFLTCLVFYSFNILAQLRKEDYWISFTDTAKDECGYRNQSGDTVIQPGKYRLCFTDTFRTYAIVVKPNIGFVAINRKQAVLYKVFPFDNGPDYISNGVFRILEGKKIGYADATTGKIIIKPRFECAYPFEKNSAKVSIHCTTHVNGEHGSWTSHHWFYIDKTGRKTHLPSPDNNKETLY